MIYLDGNSLGHAAEAHPRRAHRGVRARLGHRLIRSWDHWVDLPQRVGDVLAPLIGAGPGEVVLHDNTTLNVYQLVHGAIALRPDRTVIAISEHDFPTDRYVVDGIAAASRPLGAPRLRPARRRRRRGALGDRLPHRRAGRRRRRDGPGARRRRAGGVGPVARRRGARDRPARLRRAAGRRLHLQVPQRRPRRAGVVLRPRRNCRPAIVAADLGLVRHRDQFAMGPALRAARRHRPHAARHARRSWPSPPRGASALRPRPAWRRSTPRAALTGLASTCATSSVSPRPRRAIRCRRGNHVAVGTPTARRCTDSARARGHLPDFREPDIIRAGCSPLTTRFVDVFDALETLFRLVGGA